VKDEEKKKVRRKMKHVSSLNKNNLIARKFLFSDATVVDTQ